MLVPPVVVVETADEGFELLVTTAVWELAGRAYIKDEAIEARATLKHLNRGGLLAEYPLGVVERTHFVSMARMS